MGEGGREGWVVDRRKERERWRGEGWRGGGEVKKKERKDGIMDC